MLTEQQKPKSVERGQLWAWHGARKLHAGLVVDVDREPDGTALVCVTFASLGVDLERDILEDARWIYLGDIDPALMAVES